MFFLRETMPDLTAAAVSNAFWREASSTLRFEYFGSNNTIMEPGYQTEWRSLPFMLAAHIVDGPNCVDFTGVDSWIQNPGEGTCIAPGIHHNGRNLHQGPNLSRWSHVNFYVFGAVNLSRFLNLTRRLSQHAAQRIGDVNALLTANEESSSAELIKSARRQSLGLELLACILESSPQQELPERWLELERLAPVLRHIESNLDQSHSREDLARLIHISPSRFSALFKATLGVPPGEYIQQLQLQRAQTLLLTTDGTVAEIAVHCGHRDPFHFSRLFKRYSGLSPANYRRQVKRSFE